MELINATRMTAGYNMGLAPSGRESLVVVIKGTFRFPRADEPALHFALHEEQLPLVMADTFTGAPGLTAPQHEVDFALRKTRCDVLLLGSAHAPNGRPATRVDVGLQIGGWSKRLAVVGERRWDCGLATLRATPAQPFTRCPISYDLAYGGTDQQHEDPSQHAAYMANPVGIGFHKHARKAWVDGKPLPRTEEPERSVSDTNNDYRPMSFGPLGRGWEPRARFAGTYDEGWLEHHFPFLPPDFDERYFQAAPADQQVPLGFFGEQPVDVTLLNLTPEGVTRFSIPPLNAPVRFTPKNGPREDVNAVLDTVVIEPDLRRFSLTWRAARPLVRDMFEIVQVQVGKRGQGRTQLTDPNAFPVPVVTVPAAGGA